ncbi:DUF2182 domain-containing protein [Streptomyces sp. HU2014]|nr:MULTISPECIES: DUF2182 domain-containing protein [Streptomyces]UQI44487.1 DUF2182 domain-containing protein [Streptomyces sp. HU2014]
MTTAPQIVMRRLTLTTAVWVCAVSALAWWWMYLSGSSHSGGSSGTADMPGMSGGGHGGHHGAAAGTLSAAEAEMFLAMWAGMVIAMMLPVAVPLVAAHRFVTRPKGRAGAVSTSVFIGGYLLIWVLSGLVPLLLLAGKRWLLPVSEGSPWSVAGAGVVITAAGLFQFSGLKTRCLTVCRSPLSFVLTHDFKAGSLGTLRAGVLNGLYCLGCCWALMLVQVAVGLHNLLWMGILTLLFLAERALKAGKRIAMATGGVLAGLGVILMCDPLLHTPLAGLVG